jgi:hypothetical protein
MQMSTWTRKKAITEEEGEGDEGRGRAWRMEEGGRRETGKAREAIHTPCHSLCAIAVIEEIPGTGTGGEESDGEGGRCPMRLGNASPKINTIQE